jgi:dUTP pyrophosphatase
MASDRWLYAFIEDTMQEIRNRNLAAVTFDPGDAFKVRSGAEVGKEIEQVNSYAQVVADLTVAFLPNGVPTIGVPLEVGRALTYGKTLVVFTDTDSWSLVGAVKDAPNAKIFPLTEEGRLEAMAWLHSRPTDDTGDGAAASDPLPVLRLTDGAYLPTRGYHDDAGLDLYVDRDYIIQPNTFVDLSCGVAVELPEWGWGMITGRSSTLRTKGLLVHQGIIDAGYRGPLFAGVWNLTSRPVTVVEGERIAQLIVLPNTTKDLDPQWVEVLSDHPRGSNGFGSTGR